MGDEILLLLDYLIALALSLLSKFPSCLEFPYNTIEDNINTKLIQNSEITHL